MFEMPVVHPEKCNGCGLCISICCSQALALVNNTVTTVSGKECSWCTQCEAVCPAGAISCLFEITIKES